MAPNLDSPVQTQIAVAVLNRTLSSDYPGNPKTAGRPSTRKCGFIQRNTGFVLGTELDYSDNLHTVKKKLQLALNVPTEDGSLFGNLVSKNDPSAVKNDPSLQLTRNFLRRSSSTPCLSPNRKDFPQRDQNELIEILRCSSHCAQTILLVKDAVKAIMNGIDPIPVHSGLGGSYYFRNKNGANIAIVKPIDEEPFAPNNPKGIIGKALGQPGLKRSVRVGETGFREVAAYLLDYNHFANVPPTALVKVTHSIFHVNDGNNCNSSIKDNCMKTNTASKIASFQKYIPHDFDASDHGTSSFSVAAVHKIGILDVRIFNTDRHAGNLLVRKIDGSDGKFGAQMELIPIDHGLCLPESLEDPYFEWIHWPQSSIPFSEEELEYIENLDPVRDSEMLRMELPMIREACLRVLVLATIFLKEAAAFGLCLAEIGEMMTREFRGMEEEPSELEVFCIEARRLVAEIDVFSPESGPADDDVIQFDIDCEHADAVMTKAPTSCNFGLKAGSSRNPISKLPESLEEEIGDDNEDDKVETTYCFLSVHDPLPDVSKLSASLKGVGISETSWWCLSGVPKLKLASSKTNIGGGSTRFKGGYRSANEQLPASANFVKLSDMGEAEWAAFIDKFQELLQDAFRGRKCSAAGLRQRQRQRQRLGTSCQF